MKLLTKEKRSKKEKEEESVNNENNFEEKLFPVINTCTSSKFY
jgi:hypothetical protein